MPELFTSEEQVLPREVTANKEYRYSRYEELREQVIKANHNSEWYRNHEYIKNHQETVLSSLPENFLVAIENHLIDSRIHAQEHGNIPENPLILVYGEVFERLVEIETEKYNLFHGIEKYPQLDRDRKIGKLLLDVMHRPKKYGLTKEPIMNPDDVDLSMEQGTFVIKDATEVKTHLDEHAYRQLGRRGFKRSFQSIIDEINSMDDDTLEKHGLGDFAGYGINIDVSLNYVQKLVLPRDLKVDMQELQRDKKLTNYERADFIKMLQSGGEVVVGKSSFSRTELQYLTNWVMAELKLKQQKQAQNHQELI